MEKVQKSLNSNREIYIDELRVLATFCVIVLHCYAPYFEDSSIYATRTWWGVNIIDAFTRWGVPIFFMISGKLLLNYSREENIKNFLRRRMYKVLLPFIMWSFVYYIDSVLTTNVNFNIVNFIKNLLSNKISYHLWFVYTIIGIYLCVPIIREHSKIKNDNKLWYFFSIIFVTTSVFPIISKILGVWVIVAVPIFNGYLGWFLYGYLLDRIEFNKNNRKIIYISSVIAGLISVIGTYKLSNYLKIDSFFNGGYQVNTYIITTGVFLFSKYDIPRVKGELLRKLLQSLSKLSYGVYLIHALILTKLQIILVFNKPYIAIIVYSILVFIISYTIMFIFKVMFKRYPIILNILTASK